MIVLKEKVFDNSWFEAQIEAKCKEFTEHDKFIQRIHTLIIVQKVADKTSPEFLNERLFKFVLKLSDDPVPNIRFNVSKTIEQIYQRLSPRNKEDAREALNKMKQEQVDFDVKFYAEKALKNLGL